ncbi:MULTISPECIES: glycosyltransferase [Paenarthrobacter]|uniref:glycosyltransferase n=1 Tax=Paenarthrobacter TaxID=1742992 RepID=UPI0023666147|nr:glycosyltransferase [Paenarthrobacter sp. AB444]MDD7833551.1 glycosyltransferase [Paenarthrobacter sp. AB444]
MTIDASVNRPSTVDHILLTRFNLPSRGFESLVRAQEGWLRDRIILFERYCLPSVKAQNNRNFRWIIYFDPESPAWLLERVQELSRDGTFVPLFRAEVSPSELLEDIRSVGAGGRPVLVTTNVDNDDGLAVDFVQRVQSAAGGQRVTAIYLATGLVMGRGSLFLRNDPTNAFCSVSAPWSAPVTCWAAWHNHLGHSMSVRSLRGSPAWLQVVHDHNVSNRIRGRRVSPEPYKGLFPDVLQDVPVPTQRTIITDRLFQSPVRALRELARTTAKAVTVALLGTEGIDRIKTTFAGRKSTASRT